MTALKVMLLLFPLSLGADEALVKRMLSRIEGMPYVDTHAHVAPPGKRQPYGVYEMFSAQTYVAEFVSGSDWPSLSESLKVNGHHAYVRPFLIALRDLYGLGRGEELSERNVARVDQAMRRAHEDPQWPLEILRRARVSHLLWMDASLTEAEKAKLPAPYFPVANVDGLVYVSGAMSEKAWQKQGGKGAPPRILHGVEKAHGRRFATARQLAAFLEKSIEDFRARGGASLKTTSAYFRPLDIDPAADPAAAERAFAKVKAGKELAPAEDKALQDFLLLAAFGTARRLKMPFQVHTGNQQGWGRVADSNPLGLNKLLFSGAYYDVPFVLLHGGFPYVEESVQLARGFAHVTLDLCWMSLYSPTAARRALSQALEMLDGRRIVFGTDSASIEELYGGAWLVRRILAEVMAEKVESGYWSEEVAVRAAERVLYKNAMELYHLPEAK